MIYAIQQGDNGPIKIGESGNPDKRLRSLQTSHHEPLRLLAVSTTLRERDVHERLAAHRLSGEWFAPHEEVLRVVGEMSSFVTPQARELLRLTAGATADEIERAGHLLLCISDAMRVEDWAVGQALCEQTIGILQAVKSENRTAAA